MILASAPLTPEEVTWLMYALGVLAFLAVFVAAVTTTAKNLKDLKSKGTPQPLIVAAEKQYVERAEFERLEAKMEEFFEAASAQEQRFSDKLDEHWKELNKDRSVSTARLHERLEAVTNSNRTEVDAKLREIRQEIRDMPNQIVNLLRQTGAIGGNHN